MRRLVSVLILSSALATGAVHAQTGTPYAAPGIETFYSYNPASARQLDYTAWSDVLADVVFRVPPSNREPARGRPQTTGSHIYRGNISRYRYEANRVVYHLMDEPYEQAVHEFRVAMEALPDRIDFNDLNRDEQLAYWLNLYNATVIENILARYPESDIDRTRAAGTNEGLFEAKILNVAGVPLSLNDIRLHIVYAQWDDPRVIYGFHNGSIGGPSILREAYRGDRVWRQLDRNAGEFVNSLRGVERGRDTLRVSELYGEARRLFPDFETDLRAHLSRYANEATAEELAPARPVEADVSTWDIADMTNGVVGCTGSGSPVQISVPRGLNRVNLNNLDCYTMPDTGRVLMEHVIERRIEMWRSGEGGRVYTVDLTPAQAAAAEAEGNAAQQDDPDAPQVNLSPSFSRNAAPSQEDGTPDGTDR